MGLKQRFKELVSEVCQPLDLCTTSCSMGPACHIGDFCLGRSAPLRLRARTIRAKVAQQCLMASTAHSTALHSGTIGFMRSVYLNGTCVPHWVFLLGTLNASVNLHYCGATSKCATGGWIHAQTSAVLNVNTVAVCIAIRCGPYHDGLLLIALHQLYRINFSVLNGTAQYSENSILCHSSCVETSQCKAHVEQMCMVIRTKNSLGLVLVFHLRN